MNFEDFAADTGNTVVLKASEPELQGTIRFLISTQILADRLGIRNPVHESVKSREAEREKIVAACQRAFKREASTRMTLTDAEFEDSVQESPPQPPSDVGKEPEVSVSGRCLDVGQRANEQTAFGGIQAG